MRVGPLARAEPQRLEPGRRQDRRGARPGIGVHPHRQLVPPGAPRSRPQVLKRHQQARPTSPTWRSAALSCSPPSTPAAIQSSMRWSMPGQRGEVGADVLVGRLVEARRERDERLAGLRRRGRSARRAGRPRSRTPAGGGRAAARSRGSAGRRACSVSSPQASASSTAARAAGSAGKSGGSGAIAVELAGDLARALDLASVDLQRRHRDPGEARQPQDAPSRPPASGRRA